MIAVILFFVVIVVAAVLLGNWATKLDKREKSIQEQEKELATKQRSYSVNIAELHAKQESLRKQESKIQSEKQGIADQLNALLAKHQELNTREAEIEAKERRLGFIVTPAPDVIEPVEEPQKVVEKPHSPAYVCPLCGGKMYGRSDGKNTEYVCSDCGYIATAVPTDKKPVKKARKGGKK